ncbi:MAG: hypothetical protein ACE5RC_07395 [Nitrosopumilus sp.]
MTDSILDDVKALLDKGFGDDRILKQICRACENDEVISRYERNYVQKLAEEHLGKKPETVDIQTPAEEKPVAPDVVIPETPPVQNIQTFQAPPVRRSSNSKNSKLMLIVAGVVLAVIAAAVASLGSDSTVVPVEDETNPISGTLVIQTDLSSYVNADIISISGKSDTSGTVNLSIKNKNNELVWTEQVSIKSGGRYSTLAIAGGPGWESSGTYTITADDGAETKSTTFSFTA